MCRLKVFFRSGGLLLACVLCAGGADAQRSRATQAARAASQQETEFGPIVRAYLGYLREQQEVVDDRNSRREIKLAYYRHNLNRIKALRQMAIRIARETGNDYLPELEAVSLDEFDTLFDEPPLPVTMQEGAILNYTFRYLGAVTEGREKFYLFARLDPYEQAELRKKGEAQPSASDAHSSAHPAAADTNGRPRRVSSP